MISVSPWTENRADGRVDEKRQHRGRHGPADRRQRAEHDQRNHHRHEGRGDRVREEVLDQLDIVRRDAHEVAAAVLHEVRRGERVELAEERQAQVGEQAIGHVVR
jgi:hypothetical protein